MKKLTRQQRQSDFTVESFCSTCRAPSTCSSNCRNDTNYYNTYYDRGLQSVKTQLINGGSR